MLPILPADFLGLNEEERYAFNEDMAVRRRTAGVCGSHRGLREQQFVIVIATSAAAAAPTTSSTPAASTGTGTSAGTGTGTTAGGGGTVSVPASIKSKGTLTVAADASYPPNEFVGPDGKTVVGMDADLMNALGALMGLKIKVINETFDSIIPGLASSKYDVGASSFTDTKEREKTVDFVDYFVAGESFFTKASGGANISGIGDICGKYRRGGEGNHRGGRRAGAEREVQEGRQAGRERALVP